MLLPYHAWEMGHAIILTLIRLVITQRRLLEWETAASVAVRLSTVEGRTALRTFIMEMAASPLIAIGILATVAAVAPRSLTVALPFVALWVAAPAVAYLLSRPVVPPVWILSARDRRRLRQIARRTWHYFELFVSPESHWLPPDNFQETPDGGLARRTSPTNIGMGLLSTLAAHDLGFIDTSELVERLAAALDTIERLERHEGHLLNWYETHTLAALWPRYVSTVDSGNLVAALMALDVGLHDVASGTVGRDALRAGLDDAAELVRASLPAIARAFAAMPTVSSSIAVVVGAVQQRRGRPESVTSRPRSSRSRAARSIGCWPSSTTSRSRITTSRHHRHCRRSGHCAPRCVGSRTNRPPCREMRRPPGRPVSRIG